MHLGGQLKLTPRPACLMELVYDQLLLHFLPKAIVEKRRQSIFPFPAAMFFILLRFFGAVGSPP